MLSCVQYCFFCVQLTTLDGAVVASTPAGLEERYKANHTMQHSSPTLTSANLQSLWVCCWGFFFTFAFVLVVLGSSSCLFWLEGENDRSLTQTFHCRSEKG